MYNAFFEFEKNPFESRPDLGFFYRSQQHDASLRSLTFAVQARMGLASLVGEQGTGKTMVLESLRDSLEATQIHCAFVRDVRISTDRFFQNVASELDLRCPGTSAYQVFSALHQFTLQQALKGRTVALIVDDAHNLSADVLNEILHLASLHKDKVKLLQTILAGRPELHTTLDALNLERLQQHAILSCNLDPFTAQDTKRYIEFRLATAGLPDQTIFPPEAMAEIYHRSRGFAPAIHAICEGLLLAAFSASSKVCTPEILDQVFRKPRGEKSGVIEIAPTVVAVTRIDLARLAALPAGSEPEPVILTALLKLAFAPMPGTLQPIPVETNELLESLGMMFPTGKFVLPVNGFALGSKTRMRLGFDAGKVLPPPLPVNGEPLESQAVALPAMFPASKVVPPVRVLRAGSKKRMQPSKRTKAAVDIDPRVQQAPPAGSLAMPVVSKPVLSAEPRPQHKLERLRPNSAVLVSFPSAAPAPAIDFPSIALQPATSIVENLRARMAMATPKSVDQLVPLTLSTKPSLGLLKHSDPQAISLSSAEPGKPVLLAAKFRPIGAERVGMVPLSARPEPPAAAMGFRNVLATAIDFPQALLNHPSAPVGETWKAGALQIRESKLVSLQYGLKSEPVVASAPAGRDSLSIPCEISVQPMHPAAKLQPTGTIKRPRVPMTPFGMAECDPPAARTSDVRFAPVNLENPVGPAIAAALTASFESKVQELSHPLPLACNVSPAIPPVEQPKAFLNALPSLQPWRPFSKLEPVDPRRSFLLLSSPPPQVLTASEKPATSHRKWLVVMAIPMIAGLTLYGASPVLRSANGVVNQGWRRAHQAMIERAAVALNEDFRAGLDDWMSRTGSRPAWPFDAAGFVQPGGLALYRPSLGLTDYQMQFVGTIDKKALSWVVRAADFNNYYAVRLTVLKPGPVPTIGVTRYAVINGKVQNQHTTPLLMSARTDTVYRVSMDVRGDRFALAVQGQPVASWTEAKLPTGGIGFYSDQDAASRVAAIHVRGQNDTLGQLFALLAPSEVSSYRASLNERAAVALTSDLSSEMGGAGRGGLRSPSRGGVRLDPTFWQVPEVAVPNARRCGPGTNRIGVARPRPASSYTGGTSTTTCY